MLSLVSILALLVLRHWMTEIGGRLDTGNLHSERMASALKGASSLRDAGLVGASASHSIRDLGELAASANTTIDILATYFGSVEVLPKELFTAARNGVHVRVLMLNPEGVQIRQRLLDQGMPEDLQLQNDAYRRLSLLVTAEAAPQKFFEVRLFDGIPPFTMYRFDDSLRLGLLWHGRSTVSGPHLVVERPTSPIGNACRETFDTIWNQAVVATF